MGVVLAVDAGTTGVRSMAVTEDGRVVASRYRELTQHFPRPGWVEHDAEEIWGAVATTLAELVAGLDEAVAAVGVTNQRETTVVWDRRTDRPLHRAIVWQDRRTAALCEEMSGHTQLVRRRTGLVVDPYFSATKLNWLFGPGGVQAGPDAAFGTVDSWILWRLTGGRVHATDVTNASRTLLFDITRLRWDDELCALFGVPTSALPEVVPSSRRVGVTSAEAVAGLPAGIPVSGVAGDQQAALFGQACFATGMTKCTFGTGSFVLMNVGSPAPEPPGGLLATVAWSLGEVTPASTVYALEGSVFVTGAAIQWLRDGLGLIAEAAEAGPLAESVPDSGGVVFVPAFTGMGSPWWDPHARGAFFGLTRGTSPAHLARAAVEAMAWQVTDVVEAMSASSGRAPAELRVDGGASVMDLLLQLQADALGVAVRRAAVAETTALGAAFLAGLAEGIWASTDEIAAAWRAEALVEPAGPPGGREAWSRAVQRARSWR
ncbi:MAG TPA: glycerol kinase GlpK [Acidimicrobiales bacterium]|nr:glycerol kinase GlpK [Acidimicrobiales bacterium]